MPSQLFERASDNWCSIRSINHNNTVADVLRFELRLAIINFHVSWTHFDSESWAYGIWSWREICFGIHGRSQPTKLVHLAYACSWWLPDGQSTVVSLSGRSAPEINLRRSSCSSGRLASIETRAGKCGGVCRWKTVPSLGTQNILYSVTALADANLGA